HAARHIKGRTTCFAVSAIRSRPRAEPAGRWRPQIPRSPQQAYRSSVPPEAKVELDYDQLRQSPVARPCSFAASGDAPAIPSFKHAADPSDDARLRGAP